MDYKAQLDNYDFRLNKFWLFDDSSANKSTDDIREDLLLQLGQLESGILNQQDKDFFIFTQKFQYLCFHYPGNLSDLIYPNHIEIIFKSLISQDSFDFKNQLLDILFELTKDKNIKIFLYDKDIIGLLFQLYYTDESYFIPLCKILSSYFINTNDEVHQQILKYKGENQQEIGTQEEMEFQVLEHKRKKFFKELLDYANDINPDNREFAHSALFLISNIINNAKLEDQDIRNISDILINRLTFHKEEIDLNDIIYCFCCLIKHYPNLIILFSQPKVIWWFPHIFAKTQDQNEFIRYLVFLQHLLSCDGEHIIYFKSYLEQDILFSQIIERITDLTELSEISIIAALETLYYGIERIPYLVPNLINYGLLNILETINQGCPFSIKEIAFKLINIMFEKSDEDSAIILINCQIVRDILQSIDQFSIEFCDVFFKHLLIPFPNIRKENLESIDSDIIDTFQELASSENEIIHSYAQQFLNILFT